MPEDFKNNNNPLNQKPPKRRRNEEFNWNRVFKVVLGWSAILFGFFLIMIWSKSGDGTEVEIGFDQYQKLLNEDKIKEAVVKKLDNSYTFHGVLKQPENLNIGTRQVTADKFSVLLPYTNIDDEVIKKWNEKNIAFRIEKEDTSWLGPLIGALPWIIIIVFWIIVMRRMQGQAGGTKGIFSFGKSRAKMLNENQIRVTFKDVAGADEAKYELEEIIEFLREPTKFQKLGGKIPKGVLLLGPPGTGKTLLARAVAGEAGVPFFSISGADFVEMFVGVGASRVRDLFEKGKKNAPCIIFIDEIDAVGRHRGAGLGGGHDEREQTLNQLLVEMDGFEQNTGVIIIAATNRPDVLDPALLRPGRFDRQVVVDRPDVKGREGIFKVHTRNIPLDKNVSLEVLAKGTPGLAGADIANLVNEAALLAARKNKDKVTMADFEEAKDKVMMGMERKSLIISEKEKRTTAYHETGHVLVAKMTPEADPVHKVTIIPRGRALGVTTYLPIDEKHTYSKEYLEAMIAYAMGGRAAEKIVFNQLTTGAGNDIERATALARKMVCEWGMSEKMGPLTFGKKEEEIFLGREIAQHRDYSEQTAILIDEEVKKIVDKGMKRAEKILMENIDVLHRLSAALLEREILDAEEIEKVMKGEALPPFEKAVQVNGDFPKDAATNGSEVKTEEKVKKN
ncbi:MAG: ATP-dependent zinc metalloprotease FtsH [Chlorobi bacterium]|nr:ATP-dependent zinc metalloprotease FtsH [Chlorobiota bacterium]MCI0714947.1 ATP-dependent zinc metalloprotease FtsH [Chlorobiota bacterium]